MNIQTISIVVPTKGCVNKCKFCVSCMHENKYENTFDEFQITKRIKWAVLNGINTCIITGTGEALQNYHFLGRLADIFRKMDHPFPDVELQTSGVMLDATEEKCTAKDGYPYNEYYNITILRELGVNTISLSVSDIFDSQNNAAIIGMSEKLKFNLAERCSFIKEAGFNLRLSLNMTNVYNNKTPEQILNACKSLGANQITFRKLYNSNDNSPQTQWVKANAANNAVIDKIKEYIAGEHYLNVAGLKIDRPGKGQPLYRLPFGPMVYSIMGMSTVVDDNCMNKDSFDTLKYVILRENGKLYTQWDDEGSLRF